MGSSTNYQEFQKRRTQWRTKELEERAADIASPRPPLNNSLTDQAIRELFDRVEALEAKDRPKSTPVELTFNPRSPK